MSVKRCRPRHILNPTKPPCVPMSFVVSSAQLLKHLKAIQGVVSPNPSFPILENFLFEVGKGVLRTTASDMQTTVVSELPVEATEDVQVAVPAKMLVDALGSLPEQPVKFSIDEESYAMTLKTETGSYRISCENAVDWPRTPRLSSGKNITMPAAVLAKSINTTLFAASTEDNRPALNGVYFDLQEDKATMVATDGHRMVRYSRTDVTAATGETVQFILPRKSLNFLRTALPGDMSDVAIGFSTTNAVFSWGSITLNCRLIDERYPDYNAVIPLQNPNVLSIERLDLLNALKRIVIFTNRATNQVRWKLSATELQLTGEDTDYSNEGVERLSADYEGDPMEIGFNAKMMIDILSNIDSNLVSIEMSTPNRPGLVMPKHKDAAEDVLMLAMPIMLTSMVSV